MREEKKLAGISIQSLTKMGTIMLVAVAIGIVFLVVEIIATNNEILKDTEDYTLCNGAIVQIREASYYLTDQCRQYVKTENYTYLSNYFTEVNRTKRRENASKTLVSHNIDLDNQEYVEALALSQDMQRIEIHAMKLMAVSLGMGTDERIPEEVRAYELSAYERNLTARELKDRANMVVYSGSYLQKEAELTDKLEKFRLNITETLSNELDESSQYHTFLIHLLIGLLSVLFAVLFFSVVILGDSVVKPINIYLECIGNNMRMPLRGSVETQRLAASFNRMYEKHHLYEAYKKYEGKLNHVTGAINSVGFNEELFEVRYQEKKATLVLIEIDDFEELEKYHSKDSINIIIVEIYNLLGKIIDFKEDIFQIDKGMFGLFVYNKDSADIESIKKTFNNLRERIINSPLASEVSVSVGVAFTDISGYDQTLYNNANVALYQQKDMGGNGIQFYNPD